jgi:hypothetical protein
VADYRVTDDGGDHLRAWARGAEDVEAPHPGVGEQLHRLCTSAALELDLQGVAVALMTDRGDASAASFGPTTTALEELQFAGGGGPSRDAFATGRPVLVSDLAASDGRWPVFAGDAIGAGTCAVYALPLQLGASRFGVLTCYSAKARKLTSPEVSQLLIYAEVATDLLLEGAGTTTDGPIADLVGTVGLRSEVFQAQGMVAVDLSIGLAEALARMRAAAFLDGIDLHRLATEILDRRRQIPPATLPDSLGDGA